MWRLSKERLIDRFGKIPPEGEELIRIVPLRRLAKRLGVEKAVLKGGKMILYFCKQSGQSVLSECCFWKDNRLYGKVSESMQPA